MLFDTLEWETPFALVNAFSVESSAVASLLNNLSVLKFFSGVFMLWVNVAKSILLDLMVVQNNGMCVAGQRCT